MNRVPDPSPPGSPPALPRTPGELKDLLRPYHVPSAAEFMITTAGWSYWVRVVPSVPPELQLLALTPVDRGDPKVWEVVYQLLGVRPESWQQSAKT